MCIVGLFSLIHVAGQVLDLIISNQVSPVCKKYKKRFLDLVERELAFFYVAVLVPRERKKGIEMVRV